MFTHSVATTSILPTVNYRMVVRISTLVALLLGVRVQDDARLLLASFLSYNRLKLQLPFYSFFILRHTLFPQLQYSK